MNRKSFILIIFIANIIYFNIFAQEKSFPILKGPYLGQDTPGKKPKIFAPGIVSTEIGELGIIISPQGDEIYFCRSKRSFPTKIMMMIQKNGKWTHTKLASFSGTYSDMDPCMSSDGNRIFFGSTRPNGRMNAKGCDIWIVERLPEGSWSKPINIGQPVNTLNNENYPTIQNQNIYFHSNGHVGKGGLDIFFSEFKDDNYSTPMNLGGAINSEFNDFDATIARDGSYLIFSSNGRPDGFGSGDLYISVRKKDGTWTNAKNLGNTFNSSFMEYCPKVTPDGKYFFFTSSKSGDGDIYWIEAKIIEDLKGKETKK